MKELESEIVKFAEDRDWLQFNTPENLAKSSSMRIYNKLVRDKIPEIINADNRKAKVEKRAPFQEKIFLERVIEDGE